jgi:hypothetical protein
MSATPARAPSNTSEGYRSSLHAAIDAAHL